MVIVAIGYALKRLNIIKEEDGDGVSRIIFNVTLPSLIITTFNSMKIDHSLFIISGISVSYGALMSLLGLLIFRNEKNSSRGYLTMLVPGFNIGLFAYPLVQSIWGSEGLKYFGMFDMGNSITIFVFCYLIASYFSKGESRPNGKQIIKSLMTSIPLVSYIITISLNLFGIHFPQYFINVTGILSKANMPLTLLLLGICLNFTIDKTYYKNIIRILITRYSIGLVFGILAFIFIPFGNLFKYTLLIGFILPIGMAVIPYAVQFGYDKRFVGTMCSLTMVISFILMWVILLI